MFQKYTIHLKEKSLQEDKRIFGLDVLRVGALLMVVFSHLFLFYPNQNIITTQLMPMFGFLAVEIFLVLGGFLIGNKVYGMFVLQDDFSMSEVFCYLKYRGWRTLPNYFLVLCFAIVIGLWFQYSVNDSWEYFFFIQNFINPMPQFFPESWSIAIGFFANLILIFGMALIFNRWHFKNKTAVFLILIVSLILFSLASKFIYYLTTENTSLMQWDSDLKSVVVYRLDSFFIGALCNWFYFNMAIFWEKYKNLILLLGLILMGLMFVGVGFFRWLIDSHPFFWNVLYLPLTSIAIAFFLPVFSRWNLKRNLLKNIVTFISKISYAVYLLHFTIILQLMHFFVNQKVLTTAGFYIFSIGYLMLTLILGYVLYHFYEQPILKNNAKN